jgi:hypothetical protein
MEARQRKWAIAFVGLSGVVRAAPGGSPRKLYSGNPAYKEARSSTAP